jgi:archaeal flagellin FlaB
MYKQVMSLHKDERGLSALETAIVLIAFVVVAAVFAFTMLSAGMFSTERSKEAVYAGLEEVRGSMELRGGVVLTTTADLVTTETVTGSVTSMIFTVGNVAGGAPIDLVTSDSVSGTNTVIIDYRDQSQRKTDLRWSVEWLGSNDDDTLLEEGELAEITITGLQTSGEQALSPSLGPNTDFALEIKPPQGGVLILERRTPARIDKVMDLR